MATKSKITPVLKRLVATIIILVFALPTFVSATNLNDAFSDKVLGDFGRAAGYDPRNQDWAMVVGRAVQAFLSLLGVIFLVLTIYGGWTYMNARGDEKKVEDALGTIRHAIIGLIIILASYGISVFIVGKLSEGTLSASG